MSEGASVRALVVDDSAFMRKMISDILRDGGFEVVGAARNGREGLDMAARLKPDVMTVDVEMPVMDGVAMLAELMRSNPTAVVVLSSLTEKGGETTIRCLELGAVSCILKPSGAISLDIDRIAPEILSAVKAAARADRSRLRPTPSRLAPAGVGAPVAARAAGAVAEAALDARDAVVLIASSTGGPGALQRVVPLLPGDLAAGVVLVQHLPVGFTKPLADRLNASSQLAVREAHEGDEPRRGVVLVAPAGTHLQMDSSGKFHLNQDPPIWGVRPAADVTFTTVADRYKGRVVGAVLTGMGRDGALGAKAIRENGGYCVAQDEATSVVWGMPRAAHESGGADKLLPIDEIAAAIAEATQAVNKRGTSQDGREARAERVAGSGLRRVQTPNP